MSELERVETGLGEECGVFGAYDMDGDEARSHSSDYHYGQSPMYLSHNSEPVAVHFPHESPLLSNTAHVRRQGFPLICQVLPHRILH